jgi:hypothetical protein
MQVPSSDPLAELAQRFTAYLPTFAAGSLVLLLGLVTGWVAKRLVVRVLVWMRLDRLGGPVSWRAAFGKGDVRAALYNVLGDATWLVVVLLFFENSLQIWGLVVLTDLVHSAIVYLPNLALAGLIVGAGFLLANLVASRVEDFLDDEGAPRPRALARMVKFGLLAVVSALALWQLGLAREIVFWAFVITFGAVGVAFALGVGLGSAKAIQRGWDALADRRKERGER